MRTHKFKAKINGPWDEAVPKVSLALSDDEDEGRGGEDGNVGEEDHGEEAIRS